HAWVFSKVDFAAMVVTILVTLIMGIEPGLIAGVILSIVLHLYSASRPHIAIVGQLPGTATFRNVKRHSVVTDPAILSIRVDESLFFPNARFVEEYINEAVAANLKIQHVILECPAVNTIDISGLESLIAINLRLKDGGIMFHLSEIKGPVMDRLKRSHFVDDLTGKIHLSHYDAVFSINPALAEETLRSEKIVFNMQ
ncbi:MAG TPA: sodium-independent anion transporter, partial [Cyclobacteriaceae bacterium]|nr:sodium-independent anion transporter [Cyclobacteriaceae bacterium]